MSYSRSNASSGKNEIDLIDVAGLIVAPAMAMFIFGVSTFQIEVFGGFDLAQALWSGQGATISVALVLYLGAIGWIVLTNEFDGSDYEDYEYAAIAVAFAIVPLYALVPALESLINSHDLVRLMMWIFVSAAAVIVSYVE